MSKIQRRAITCILLVALLGIGTGYFIYEAIANGSAWATFYANQHVYSEGKLNVGNVHDCNGVMLAENSAEGVKYNENEILRRATVHTVGDCEGNVATGALYAFRSKLVGYSILDGTYSISASGRDLYLTINADYCKKAYTALGGYTGCIGVYNYKTGEIVAMTSKPSFDPENITEEDKKLREPL